MIGPVICASEKTNPTNLLGDQHRWSLYLKFGIIRIDICQSPKKCTWILLGQIPGPLKCVKNIDEAWYSEVGGVLSQLRNLDITGTGLKWDCADGFQWRCYPLLAAWVGDYAEHDMVGQVSYGSCSMCETPKHARIGHSTFRPPDTSTDLQIILGAAGGQSYWWTSHSRCPPNPPPVLAIPSLQYLSPFAAWRIVSTVPVFIYRLIALAADILDS